MGIRRERHHNQSSALRVSRIQWLAIMKFCFPIRAQNLTYSLYKLIDLQFHMITEFKLSRGSRSKIVIASINIHAK